MAYPTYTWDSTARQYRDMRGRYIARADVRDALDAVIDEARFDIETISRQLSSGKINLPAWQLEMERIIKVVNVGSGAIGKGGHLQAGSKDWEYVGSRVKKQYGFLRDFALEIEQGLPLGDGFVNRAKLYAMSGTGTYEAVLRRDDLDAGFDEERRITHSLNPCDDCERYKKLGWRKAGVLPDVGEKCKCQVRCRCTFERRRKGRKTI